MGTSGLFLISIILGSGAMTAFVFSPKPISPKDAWHSFLFRLQTLRLRFVWHGRKKELRMLSLFARETIYIDLCGRRIHQFHPAYQKLNDKDPLLRSVSQTELLGWLRRQKRRHREVATLLEISRLRLTDELGCELEQHLGKNIIFVWRSESSDNESMAGWTSKKPSTELSLKDLFGN